jgi:hypothetical protein
LGVSVTALLLLAALAARAFDIIWAIDIKRTIRLSFLPS